MGESLDAARRSTAARWLRGIYLICCNTLLLLLVGEIGARWFAGGASERWSRERVTYTLHPFMQTANPPDARADPGPLVAGWWVDPAETAHDAGRVRLLFLGGSTTKTDYPQLVRRELEPKIGPATGYNLGADWHCSLHSLYKLWTYVDDLRPDLVIVLHNVNDFYRGFTPPALALPQYRPDYSHHAGAFSSFWSVGRSSHDGRPVFHCAPRPRLAQRFQQYDSDLGGMVTAWLGESELLRAARRGTGQSEAPIHRPRPRKEAAIATIPHDEVLRSLPAFERNMDNIRATCALKCVPVVFLTMPYTSELGSESNRFLHPGIVFSNDGVHHLDAEGFVLGMERFNQAILALARDDESWVLDLAAELDDPALFLDEVHLRADGIRRQAAWVARFVLENEILRER